MVDAMELEALRAALRGALSTSAELAPLLEKLAPVGSTHEVSAAEWEDLSRVTLAHAVGAQALRALVEAMRARRSEG